MSVSSWREIPFDYQEFPTANLIATVANEIKNTFFQNTK